MNEHPYFGEERRTHHDQAELIQKVIEAVREQQHLTDEEAQWVRLTLLAAGHLATVNAAIAAMTGPQGDAARIEWEFRARVRRDSPLTQTMASTIGLSETDLDELFATAATL
jgi:hypothetical protein